jgi:hypothetical protein
VDKMRLPLLSVKNKSRTEIWKSYGTSTFIKLGDISRLLDIEDIKTDGVSCQLALNPCITISVCDISEVDILGLSGSSLESVCDVKFVEEIEGSTAN